MSHGRERAVCMHHSDLLPHKHTAQQREAVETGCGCGLVVHHLQGQVVHLESVGQVPDTLPGAIGVGDYDHLVSLFNQTLRELVNVAFHSPHIGVEEVGHHAYVVLLAGSLCRGCGHPLR